MKRLRNWAPGVALLLFIVLIRCEGPSADAAPLPLVPCPQAPLAFQASGALAPALRARVARSFAPQLRFNAWVEGDDSPQNLNEDLFPMSVARFLRDAASGKARVLVERGEKGAPSVSEVREHSGELAVEDGLLVGFPRDMVGDVPGEAPLYVHVYEDSRERRIDGRGSGEVVVYVEYWVYYPMDRCEAVVLGQHLRGEGDRFGHRSDWEHTTYRARVRLGPLGSWSDAVLEEGYYFGHDKRLVVSPGELQTVEGHPVVFISQGKHASYPVAGRFELVPLPGFLGAHTDVFRGNGVRVDTWKAPLVDMQAPAPEDLALPEWRAAAPGISDWTRFLGRWGPDRIARIELFGTTIALGNSPSAPPAKSTWCDFGGRGNYTPWRDYVSSHAGGRLTLFAEEPPAVVPPPAVIRR